jgi:hypothetical protein
MLPMLIHRANIPKEINDAVGKEIIALRFEPLHWLDKHQIGFSPSLLHFIVGFNDATVLSRDQETSS